MKRRMHLVAAIAVALGLDVLAAVVIGYLISDRGLAVGIGLLVGVVIGMCVVAYWEEVIDRAPNHTDGI